MGDPVALPVVGTRRTGPPPAPDGNSLAMNGVRLLGADQL
jgi:hypothetical protein